MPRSPLPQNYTLNSGTLLEDFENAADWTVHGTGTIVNNPVEYKTGSNSIKYSCYDTEMGGSKAISKTFGIAPRLMYLWVYLHTLNGTYHHIRVRFSSTELRTDINTKCFYADLNQDNAAFTRVAEGWNLLVIHRDDWIAAGGEIWTNEMKWLKINVQATGSATLTLSLDNLHYEAEKIPRCIITFDDNRASAYSEGYGYMQPRGIKGTAYTVPTFIGNSTYMTLANLNTLYAAGWALGNHSYNHVNLTGLATQALMETEMNACTNWLINNGFPRAAYHGSYPGGGYNSTVLAAIAACNIKTMRADISGYVSPPGGNQHLLKLRTSDSATLAGLKAKINTAIKYDATVILLFHELVTSVSQPSTQWLISDFQALIDYIVARKIKCVTIDEWYQGLNNPRYGSLLR